ncbi:hypothetical protein [Botrimarina sp.]|uniref:hypothetical protein n=1 Tax=Botrimarina sp. TaxID=2795802 RepID=UPI0032EB5CDD
MSHGPCVLNHEITGRARRLALAGGLLLAAVGVTKADTQSPEQVISGVGARADAIFLAEAGKPLQRARKQPPLSKTRGPYVRAYSYSIVAFAARCLYLGERVDEANDALVENAKYYLDNPLVICDRDSFHWHAEIVLRLLEMYGPRGAVDAGRISEATESWLLKYMWVYTKKCSWLGKAEYEASRTWDIYGSENHHAMDFTCHWHFAKYARDLPAYRDKRCDDGATLSEHFEAWNTYFVAYCLERARRGLCVEMRSDGYNSTLIKGFYNFYDFGDEEVRRAAGRTLDMYFAYWAEEQLMGHMGGGGSRVKGNNAFVQSRTHGNAVLAWLYFAIGEQPKLNGHDVGALLSGYRPPAVVADIARDAAGRGVYEIRQRVQGLGIQGDSTPHMDQPNPRPNRLRADGGGILRYSYCDPAFILGTPMTEARPLSDWVAISTQSRWQGVVFAGEHDPRIVAVPRPKDNRVAFNQFWSVQSKGSLVTQKLRHNKGAAEMMVWFSDRGLSEPVAEDGIVFVEAPGAYAAVRVAAGGFTLEHRSFEGVREEGGRFRTRPGHVMTPEDEYTPVVLEVMSKREAGSLASFKERVKNNELSLYEDVFTCETIYGDVLSLDTTYAATPTVNGEPIDYAPDKVFDSPFLESEYGSGLVTIRKGDRQKMLDFN